MTVNNFKNNNYQLNNNIKTTNNNNINKETQQTLNNNFDYKIDDKSLVSSDNTKVVVKVIPFIDEKPLLIPSEIKSDLLEINKTQEVNNLDNIVKNLSKYFDKSGKILASTRKELSNEILNLLKDENIRSSLINKLGLNTPDNIDKLLVTMCVEADDGFRGSPNKNLELKDPTSVKENILPLGATVINRYLSTAIIEATSQYSKTGNIDNFKAKTFEAILTEPNQIAYGATSLTKRKEMINFMKNNSTYDLHRQVANDLMKGKSNFEIRVQEKVKTTNGKFITKETKKIVNSGNFFHYASPADKVPVINEKLPWTKTPNGHRFSTYPPKHGKEQGIYYIGKNGGKNINWNS